MNEAGDALAMLVRSVLATGKPGTMTFNVKVSPAARGSSAVAVETDVTCKLPRPAPESTLFYSDESGNLLRDNPQQARLDLRPVTPATATTEPEQSVNQ